MSGKAQKSARTPRRRARRFVFCQYTTFFSPLQCFTAPRPRAGLHLGLDFPPAIRYIDRASRRDGIGRRAGLKRRQLPLSSTRIHDRKSLEEPSCFGNPESLSFFEGASVADRLTRASIRTHFPTQKALMPVWWNWQTPGTQNPVSARTCGFDPRHRHHPGIPKALFYGGFRDFHIPFRR